MATREIPQAEWGSFLDRFSNAYAGWPATLDIIGPEVGSQHQIEGLPLIGVTGEGAGAPTVYVHAGAGLSQLTHQIDHVTHLRIDQPDGGQQVALQIESADDQTAILMCRSPFGSALAERGPMDLKST
ncbi:MAG TPA: DUF5335 family protein [Vicinamibacterales bacterium]